MSSVALATNLSSCSNITSPGYYYLNSSISSFAGTCFNISVSNVTIDALGNSIDGDDSDTGYSSTSIDYGIYVSGQTNITIKNFGDITDFGSMMNSFDGGGIYLFDVNNSKIYNSSITTNYYGVYLNRSFNNEIINNSIDGNAYHLGLFYSNRNIIRNATLTSAGAGPSGPFQGLFFQNSSDNTALNLTSDSNSNYNLYLSGGSNNTFNNCSFTNSGAGIGIDLYWSLSNIFNSVRSSGNSVADLFYDTSPSLNNSFTDSIIVSYLLDSAYASTLTYENASYGKISFLNNVSTNGVSRVLTSDIIIRDNYVYVNSSGNTYMNVSANVTLYNIGDRGFVTPTILKNGTECTDCYNFTSLNTSTVIFNVTSWSDYEIGEGFNPTIIIERIHPLVNVNVTQNKFFNVTVNITCAGEDCGEINVTSVYDGSIIPFTIGSTPFYTNNSNPRQVTLNAGETVNVTFWVNATGPIGNTYDFYAYANVTALMGIGDDTPVWETTIIPPPRLNISLVHPLARYINVTKDRFFNVTVNVSCYDAYCGVVNVSLDPYVLTPHYVNQTGGNASHGADTMSVPNTLLPDEYIYFFSSSELNAISADDTAHVQGTGWPSYNAEMFQIPITESASDINQINITYKGYCFGSMLPVVYSTKLYVWNQTSLTWKDTLQSHTINSKQTLQYSVSEGFSDLMNNGSLYVLVIGPNANGVMGACDTYFIQANVSWLQGLPGKGLISTVVGATPFYTNNSNPRPIVMNANTSQLVTFWVNASGSVGSMYEFYAYANITTEQSISNLTNLWNVTIVAYTEETTPSAGGGGGSSGGSNTQEQNLSGALDSHVLVCPETTFIDKLFSDCRIANNSICDYGEYAIQDPECNVVLEDITDGTLFRWMWFVRAFLALAAILLFRKSNLFPATVIILIALFAVNGAFGSTDISQVATTTPGSELDSQWYSNWQDYLLHQNPMLGIILLLVALYIISFLTKKRKAYK